MIKNIDDSNIEFLSYNIINKFNYGNTITKILTLKLFYNTDIFYINNTLDFN